MKIDLFNPVLWARAARLSIAALIVTSTVRPDARAAILDSPTLVDDLATVSEDTSISCIDALANDTDPQGRVLSIVSIESASFGIAALNGNCISYSPNEDFNGTDMVRYTVSNGVMQAEADIEIEVMDVNDAPVAPNRTVSAPQGGSVTIDITSIDVDANPLSLSFLSFSPNGTVSGDYPILTYTPDPGFTGTDIFDYRVTDGLVNSAVARVEVTVVPGGGPEPQPSTGPAPQSNPAGPEVFYEFDPENPAIVVFLDGSASTGSNLTYAWTQVSGPPVVLNDATNIRPRFIPPALDPRVLTAISFELTVTDDEGRSDTEVFNASIRPGVPARQLTVAPVAPAYVNGDAATFDNTTSLSAYNGAPTIAFSGPLAVDMDVTEEVTAGVSDPDGDPFLVTFPAPALHGTFSYLTGTDEFRYVPAPGYTGPDRVVVRVQDQYSLQQKISLIEIEVTDPGAVVIASNGPPSAPNVVTTTNYNTNKNVLLAATDPDADPLTYQLLAIYGGTLTGMPVGATLTQPTVTFQPEFGFTGEARFIYSVSDTSGALAAATVTIAVLDPDVNTRLYFRHPERNDAILLATSSGYGAAGFTFDSRLVPDGDYNASTEPNRFYTRAQAADGRSAIAASDTRVDNTPPTAAFVPGTPANGAYVGGTMNPFPVRATAVDNFPDNVNAVLFKDPRDGTTKAMDEDGAEYTLVYPTYEGYDSTALVDGTRRIQVNAIDRAGNRSANVVRDLLIDNTPPANLTVSIPSMTPERLVRRMVNVNLSASDPASGTLSAGSGLKSLDLTLVVSPTNQPNVHHADAAATTYTWNTSGWPDGTYSLRLDALDNVGNLNQKTESNIIVDNSAPIVSISAPAEGATLSGLVTVSATASDANGITNVKLFVDGVLKQTLVAAPYTFSLDTALETNGDHVIRVTALDKAGNTGSRTRNVTTSNVDGESPTVSITAPSASSLLRGNVNVTASAADNVAVSKVEFFVDGAMKGIDATAPYSFTWNSATSANGGRSITARATDSSGNASTSAAVAVTVDNALPSIVFDAPAVSSFLKGVVSVNGSATDNLAIAMVEFLVDGVSQGTDSSAPYSFSWNTGSFSDGLRSLRLMATDTAGNAANAIRSVTVDKTAPVVTITGPADGATVNGATSITASVVETNVDRVDFLIDDVVIGADSSAPFSFSWDASAATNGSHAVKVRATDRAGNEGSDSVTVTVTGGEDLTVGLSNPADGATVRGTIPVTVNPSTTGGNTPTLFELFVDGAPAGTDSGSPFTIPLDTTGFSDGDHTIRVVVHDSGGNDAETTVTVQVDNTLPTASILSPTDGAEVRGAITVSAAAGDNVELQRVDLLVDGSVRLTLTSAPYDFSLNTTLLSNGSRALQARAVDVAGNAATSAAVNVTVDNEAPVVAINEPAAGEHVRGTLTIRGAASDNRGISTIEYFVDGVLIPGSATPPYEAVWDTTSLSEGDHVLRIAARDAVGNEGFATHTVTVENVDVTNPTVTLTSPSNGTRLSGTATVRASASDNFGVERVEFWVNGALQDTDSTSPYTYAWNTSPLVNGAHVLQAKAFDVAGNAANSAMISVSVDNQRPDITLSSPANGANVSGSQTLQMNFSDNMEMRQGQISVDGNAVAFRDDLTGVSGTLGFQLDTLTLTDGLHTVGFEVMDAAGNTRQSSSLITVQNAGGTEPAPTFRIINAANNAYLSGPQNLEIEILSGTATSVIFRIDGVVNNGAPRAGFPNRWIYRWLTGSVADGTHTIEYVAANASAFTSQSALVTTINTPPTISFEAPAPNAIIWGVKNIRMRASAGIYPVNNVMLRIGTEDVFQAQGNTPVTNTLYVYGFDSEVLIDGTDQRRFPDGDYTLYAEVTDAAGNRASTTVPITIDTRNIPISPAIIHEFPADGSMPATDAENDIYVTFENADPDPAAVVPSSLVAYIANEDGEFRPISGTVGFSGGALRLNNVTIPPNSFVKVVMRFQDTDGKALRKTWFFKRPIRRDVGGVVVWKNLTLEFPRRALKKDLYINIVDMRNSGVTQQADLNTSGINQGQETIFGPLDIWGNDLANVERFTVLDVPAVVRYERPAADQTLEDLDKVYDIQRLDSERNIWRTLSTGNGPLSSTSGGTLTAKQVNAALTTLGVLRVASAPAPAPGLHELFSFPNPFSPDEGGVDLHYILGADSDVNIVIYDLLGNLVRKIDIGAGAPGGRYAQNIYRWDGRNGEGETVASGGYIMHIIANGRDGSRTKSKYKIGVAR